MIIHRAQAGRHNGSASQGARTLLGEPGAQYHDSRPGDGAPYRRAAALRAVVRGPRLLAAGGGGSSAPGATRGALEA